mgnify:CR=1 FL=1
MIVKAYRITKDGQGEVWPGYQCVNLDSALATAHTWQENTYDFNTRRYAVYKIFECEYQHIPWGTPIECVRPIEECNPVLVYVFNENGQLTF